MLQPNVRYAIGPMGTIEQAYVNTAINLILSQIANYGTLPTQEKVVVFANQLNWFPQLNSYTLNGVVKYVAPVAPVSRIQQDRLQPTQSTYTVPVVSTWPTIPNLVA